MAKKSLDEIFGGTAPTSSGKKSLDDIFGGVSNISSAIPEPVQPEKSFLQKTGDVLGGLGAGAIKGLASTTIKASKLGVKALQGITGIEAQGQPIETLEKAEQGIQAQGTAEKIGFGAEQIAELFTPVGIETKGLNLLSRMALGAGEFGGKAALQSGGDTRKTIEGAIAGAIPVEKILSPVASFFTNALKRTGSAIAGKGMAVIDEVLANPQAGLKGLKGENIKILTDAAKSARDEVIRLSRQASTEYGQALEELPKRLGAQPKVMQVGGKTTIKAGNQTYILSLQGVKSFLTSKLKNIGVIVDRKKNYLDFTQSPLRTSEENILRDVFKTIDNWIDTSPKGLNNLAVKVGNFKAGEQSKLLNSVIGKVKSNIRDYIGFRVPAVQELNAKYAKSMDFIDALRTELSVPNNLKTTENLMKTAKKIQNLFTNNKDLARNLIKEMQGGVEMIATEAGRQLAQAPSRATVSIGDTARSLIQAVIPPKAIGEIAAYTGIAEQKLQPIIETLAKFAPAERVALFTLFRDLMSDSQENQ